MNRPFLALLFTLFAGGVAATPIRTLLPAYVEGVLRQPPLLTSVLLAIQLGVGGLAALLAGALAHRVGQRAIVIAGLTTPLFGAALFVLGAPPLLALVAVVWGVAAGCNSAGGQSFMISAVRRERLGTASAAYFITSTASGAAGAYVAGLGADHLGYGAVAVGSAVAALAAIAGAAAFLPPLVDSPRRPSTSHPPTTAAAAFAASAAPDRPAGYADLLGHPDVVGLCAIRFFPTVAWGAASLAIPLLLFRLGGGAATTVGAYGTVSLLCAAAAQLGTGRLVDLRSKHAGQAIRPLLAPLSAGIVAAAALAGAAAQAGAFYPLFVAGTLWTMTAWALSTTMPPLIRELSAPISRSQDRLVGLAHLMWSAGMLAGTLGAGLLIDLAPAAPFVLALTCLAATVAVAVWLTALPARAYAAHS